MSLKDPSATAPRVVGAYRENPYGTLVHFHTPDSFDVEFVLASGRTQALLMLADKDVRPVREDDLMGVRRATPAAGVVDGTRP